MILAKIATLAKGLFEKNDTRLAKLAQVIIESGEYCASGHMLAEDTFAKPNCNSS
jgi:hypothetical protein